MASSDATLPERFARWDAERKEIDAQLAVLCQRRNNIAPIACFPWELVNRIFLEVRDSWEERDVIFPPILRVCRSWRAQALGYGPLWTKLNCFNVKTAKRLAGRTSSTSLDLSLIDPVCSRSVTYLDNSCSLRTLNIVSRLSRVSNDCLYLLVDLIPRARSLNIVDVDLHDNNGTTRELWPASARHLEHLKLVAARKYTVPFKFIKSVLPHLRTLSLIGCQMNWRMPGPFSKLTVFDLRCTTDDKIGNIPPMPDLFDALRQMVLLERFEYRTYPSMRALYDATRLKPDGSMPIFYMEEEPEPEDAARDLDGLQDVHLPKLKHLHVLSTLDRTLAIMKHFPHPQEKLEVEVRGNVDKPITEVLDIIEKFGRHITKGGHSLSAVYLAPHIHRPSFAITITFWDITQGSPSNAPLQFTYNARMADADSQPLAPILGSALLFADVTTFFVGSLKLIYAEDFRTLQGHMPQCTIVCINVESLHGSLPAISNDQFCHKSSERLLLEGLKIIVIYGYIPNSLQVTSRKPDLTTSVSFVAGLRSLPRQLRLIMRGWPLQRKDKL